MTMLGFLHSETAKLIALGCFSIWFDDLVRAVLRWSRGPLKHVIITTVKRVRTEHSDTTTETRVDLEETL